MASTPSMLSWGWAMSWRERWRGRFGRLVRRSLPPAVQQEPTAGKHPQPNLRFLPDTPHGEDRFGRSPFARALAGALVLPVNVDGLVVGIEGAWGSGKTFVINQIKSILREDKSDPIVVDFNPWVVSGTDS